VGFPKQTRMGFFGQRFFTTTLVKIEELAWRRALYCKEIKRIVKRAALSQ